MSIIGSAFVEVLPMTGGFASRLKSEVGAATQRATQDSASSFNKLASAGKMAIVGLAGAAVAGGLVAVKMAGNFQQSMTQLVTGAGEAAGPKGIGLVSAGILKMGPQVGMTAAALAAGMYMIESAGFHGAQGLSVLKAAAQGARVGNADLATVSNALTTALVDYHMPASKATAVTSMLVATVAAGKTHMQDLAGALTAVLPAAAAAGVGLTDVLGALATMTGQGISAQQAAQDVANTIRNLEKPSQQATKEMGQLGLSALDVSEHLGQRGLSGTLGVLVEAIARHMGPAGLVLLGTFKQSQDAASAARVELEHMPPGLQKLAQAYYENNITQKQWRSALKGMAPEQRQLAQQFAATVNQTHGFSDALKSGRPAAQTMSGALSEMLGGATGLNTALALTGPNMATYHTNIKNIAAAGKEGSKQVKGWGDVQKDFNFKVDAAKAYLNSLLIVVGTKLIPVVEKAAAAVMHGTVWLERHKAVALAIAGVIGGVLTAAISAYIAKEIAMVVNSPFGKLIIQVAKWAAAQLLSVTESIALWLMYTGVVEGSGMAMMLAGGVILLAVAAIAAAAYLIYRNWGTIKKFFEGLWKDVVRYFHDAWHDIKGAWGDAVAWFQNLGHDISHAFQTVVNDIKGFFEGIADWFKKWWPLLLPIAMGLFFGPLGFVVGVVISEIIQHWQGFKQALTDIWRALWVVVGPIWHAISRVITFEVDIIRDYLKVAWAFITTALHVAWDAIKAYFEIWWAVVSAVFGVAFNYIKTVLEVGWNVIKGTVMVVWDAIKAYFTIWWAVVSAIVQVAWDLIRTIFNVALDLITGKWGKAWGAIRDFFSTTWDTIKGTAETVWAAISGFFISAWGTFEGTVKSTWKNIVGGITGAWDGLKGSATSIWNTVKGIFVSGINDIIRVINDFITALDIVPGVNIHKIGLIGAGGRGGGARVGSSAAMSAAKLKHFAGGGILPVGAGFWTGGEVAIAGEGNPAYPEAVIPTDPAYRSNALALTRQLLDVMGVRRLSIGSFLGGVLSKVRNFVGGILSPAVGAAQHVADAAMGGLPFPANDLGTWAVNTIADAIKKLLTGKSGGAGGGKVPGFSGAGGVAQWAPIANAVAAALNQPGSAGAILRRVQFESGGDPYAVNRTDINWQLGHPSVGLAQVIAGTYAAYSGLNKAVGPFAYGVSEDPLANMYAGMNYATQTYGSIAAVDPLRRPIGYDSGGWLEPGFTPALNLTGHRERVLGPGQHSIYIAPGAVPVSIAFTGGHPDAAAVEAAVQRGVTAALNDLADIIDQHSIRTS